MLLQKEIHRIVGQLLCILNFSYIFIGIITTPSDLVPAYLKQIVFTTHLLIHRKWLLHPMQYTFFALICVISTKVCHGFSLKWFQSRNVKVKSISNYQKKIQVFDHFDQLNDATFNIIPLQSQPRQKISSKNVFKEKTWQTLESLEFFVLTTSWVGTENHFERYSEN